VCAWSVCVSMFVVCLGEREREHVCWCGVCVLCVCEKGGVGERERECVCVRVCGRYGVLASNIWRL
jgi:hypothetical protein